MVAHEQGLNRLYANWNTGGGFVLPSLQRLGLNRVRRSCQVSLATGVASPSSGRHSWITWKVDGRGNSWSPDHETQVRAPRVAFMTELVACGSAFICAVTFGRPVVLCFCADCELGRHMKVSLDLKPLDATLR